MIHVARFFLLMTACCVALNADALANSEQHKKWAAEASLVYLQPGMVVGVGTGSTVAHFIDALAKHPIPLRGVLASSERTEQALRFKGFHVLSLSEASPDIYIDGADRFNDHKELIKGGGGALVREKILANLAPLFVCIVDDSKHDPELRSPPLPVEVVPFALSSVQKALASQGLNSTVREGVSDNGNVLLDVAHPAVANPKALELALNQITGVVDNGLFAHRHADVILVAGDKGVRTLQ